MNAFSKIILASLAFIIQCGSVKATTFLVNGDTSWTGDQDFSNNGRDPITAGIRSSSDGGTISTDGNITASENVYGIYLTQGISTIVNSQDGKTLYTHNNFSNTNIFEAGIFVSEQETELNIYDMNVSALGNDDGIIATVQGKINIDGTNMANGKVTSNQNMEHNSTDEEGYGIYSLYNASINITNMDVEANYNGSYGIASAYDGNLIITGRSDGSNKVTANNTGISYAKGSGIEAYMGSMSIKNMDIDANNNKKNGLVAHGAGIINIESSNQISNTLNINNNHNDIYYNARGIVSVGNSQIIIKDMNVSASGNDVSGILADNRSLIDISSTSSNILTVDNNANVYYEARGITSENDSQIIIKDMDIFARGNDMSGILANNGSLIDISSTNTNALIVDNNTNDVYFDGRGIYSNVGSTIEIKNMGVSASGNGLSGLFAYDNSFINIYSDNTNGVHADNNRNGNSSWNDGIGIHTFYNNAQVNIKEMDVTANNNGKMGLYAQWGSQINVQGKTDGSNQLSADNNRTSDNSDGIGIFSVDTGSEVKIENMEVSVNKNAYSGIYASNGGHVKVLSDNSNTLKVSNNKNDDSSWSSGFGIFSFLRGSLIDVRGMNIDVSNNGNTGVYTGAEGIVNLVGNTDGTNTLSIKNNQNSSATNGYGIYSADSGSLMNIENMDIDISGSHYGIRTTTGGKSTITGINNGRNSLLLSNNAIYGIITDGNNSKLDITKMNVSSQGSILASTQAGGSLNIYESSLSSSDNWVFSTAGSQGTIYVEDSFVYSDIGSLLSSDADNSSLMAENSSLTGYISTNSGTSTVSLNESSWNMINSSNISNFIAINSDVNLRGNNYNNLLVENYNVNNANLFLNTFFGGGGVLSDKLVVAGGDAVGNSVIYVNSTGSDGTSPNILVVDLNGATDKSAQFSLYGNVIDTGAYEYRLNQLSDENWYLTPEGLNDTAKTLSNVPGIFISNLRIGMDNLMRRMGEIRENNKCNKEGAWAKTYAKHVNISDLISTHTDIYGFEAGYDHGWYKDANNRFYVGVMAGYLYNDNIRTEQSKGFTGNGNGYAPSIGIYGTWVNKDGWFADAVIRNYWMQLNMESFTSKGEIIKYHPNTMLTSASLEAGRHYEKPINEKSSWFIEPKTQVIYSFAGSEDFTTSNDKKVHYGDINSLIGKISISLGYTTELSDNTVIEPYLEVGLLNEFGGKTDIVFDGGKYKSDFSGFSYELTGGINTQMDNNWSTYSSISYEKGDKIEAVSGNLGVRYTW